MPQLVKGETLGIFCSSVPVQKMLQLAKGGKLTVELNSVFQFTLV